MKKIKKKSTKVVLSILAGLGILAVSAIVYINITNLDVNSGIRIQGYVIDKFTKADDAEDLIAMNTSSSTKTPKLKSDDTLITEEQYIKTRGGKDLRVLIFKPIDAKPNATGLLWIHGGGYAGGSPDSEFSIAKKYITTANTIVVSPDYTKSIEAPYPAALNDCYDTLVWMKENASMLGINKDQLFTAGASAGGGLTAAVTLYARDHDDVNIAFQMPLYPMINDKMNTSSAIGNTSFLWDSKRNHAAWSIYLGDLFGSNHVPKYAAAARETDYSKLPPTYTFVGNLDPFYDDTIAYAHNLKADGVAVEYDIYKGAYHGFDAVAPNAQITKEAWGKLLDSYAYAAENYFAKQSD